MSQEQVEQVVLQSRRLARERQHAVVTIEHLFLMMLESPGSLAIQAMRQSQSAQFDEADLTKLIGELNTYLDKLEKSDDRSRDTMGFNRVVERSNRIAAKRVLKPNFVSLLLSIIDEPESIAAQLIRRYRVYQSDVSAYYMQEGATGGTDAAATQEQANYQVMLDKLMSSPPSAVANNKPASSLDDYLDNLNVQYRQGELPPLVGRKQEILATVRVLAQSHKSNVILVGEPGVGKTSIAVGLAQLIEEGQVPKHLKGMTVYSLNMTALMAGTQYRGEFEQRLNGIVNFLKRNSKAILFIDEIHMIVGAGSTGGNQMDLGNILKPALASGKIKCVGATTYKEYRLIFEKEEALARRFQQVEVPEPTIEEGIEILRGLKPKLESYHQLVFSEEALQAAVKLSKQYIKNRFLPDIAIDVLDEAGAAANMGGSDVAITVGEDDIAKIVSAKARVPIESMNTTGDDRFKELDDRLRAVIFGQDHAIKVLVSAVRMAHAGLRDESKPVGSFLFAGPTGVGKTELTKQLAKELDINLLRFDMSEYMESHTVSKLIGAPPGYVGHNQPGLLTEEVNKHPHSIVLLDEIEKAHVDIYNLLLQVMDYGKLTDSQGRKIDFTHVTLIMTTNAGASALQKRSIGFNEQDALSDSNQELAKTFTPEFRNRLDEIIQFNPLSKEVLSNVIKKLVQSLQHTLAHKNVTITISTDAIDWFVAHNPQPEMGARPLSRYITQYIKKPLAEELLYGALKKGGRVLVDCHQGELLFRFSAAE
jgi:ATP-dependent Clp protease ATP-binding subunit ClpA